MLAPLGWPRRIASIRPHPESPRPEPAETCRWRWGPLRCWHGPASPSRGTLLMVRADDRRRGGKRGTTVNSGRFRRLVVVRAGDASLHPQWLGGSEPATFDLAVSYYDSDPNAFAEAQLRHIAKGGKWEGLHAFFADNPKVLHEYDWIWLPDDDIATTTPSINRLFDLVATHELDIAQPSLSWDSYVGPFITLHNPCFQIRWTNFVEVMAPVFSSNALRRIVPAFEGRRFSWGTRLLVVSLAARPNLQHSDHQFRHGATHEASR